MSQFEGHLPTAISSSLIPSTAEETPLKITGIKLYTIDSGNVGEKGAAAGESQYWGGDWQANTLISNPMSVYPEYSKVRTLWMGPGQDPYAVGSARPGAEATRLQPARWKGARLPENGKIRLSDAPGFGVELNRKYLKDFKS